MYLVIGPGAMAVYAFLGALSAIDLDTVDEVSGCSAGAIIGLFVAIGKTLDEIKDLVFTADLKGLTKLNIVSLIKNFGLISHTPIKAKLREMCGGDPKFKDLPKKLYVTSFCLNKMETEYFSVDNVPDMSVIDAVCMSMSVPFLFETSKLNTFTYLDGAVRETVPSLCFLNKDPRKVMIIQRENHKKHSAEITTIREFLNCVVNVALESSVDCGSFPNRVRVNLETFNLLNFEMEYEEKVKMYVIGYQTALSHLGSFK
jgi:predicted acylesterase/phospholipase RssA